MTQNLNPFQKNRKLFYEELNSFWSTSSDYAELENDLDQILLLADRVLAAYQEDIDFNRTIKISGYLDKLSSDTNKAKLAEEILEDIELWLRAILSFANPTLWQTRRTDDHYALAKLIREDLNLLSRAEISWDVDHFYQIGDSVTQLIFLAYKYRNSLTHSTRGYSELIRARFLPAGLSALIAPVYKYKKEIREALSGLIVSSFVSTKNINMLSLINSERQKHLINFRGREEWLYKLSQKLTTHFDKPQPYILLHGHEGMGKSALVAKITEELSTDVHAIGRNAGVARKNAPWLPNAIIHFGKQSNQPNEIFDMLLAQINTLLLEPINLDYGNFANRELQFEYFGEDKSRYSTFENSSGQSRYGVDDSYTSSSSRESKVDPFRSESFDFTRYRRVLYLALQQVVKEKGNITLVIDAVDEISPDGSGLQFLPESLPVGVSALLSAREPKVVKWLENNRDVEVVRIKELTKSEIPLFTGINNEDGDKQARFNERVWKASSGWPLMVLEASKLVQDNADDLDRIQIDKGKLFDRRVNEWRMINGPLQSEIIQEILILLSIFESVSPLDLDMIQAFIERNGTRYSRDEIKQSLQLVTSQLEGLDANRIKLALKAFAEYIREQWLGKIDLQRMLEEIVQWLARNEHGDSEIISRFLNFWASPSQSKAIRDASEKLLDVIIQNKESEVLYNIYRDLRKQSKQSTKLTDIMKRCLVASASLGNVSGMRTLGWRLVDGTGLEKDVTTGISLLEKAAVADDVESMLLLANCYLDGKNVSKNVDIGEKWLAQAIESNDEHVKYVYARRLLEGNGLSQDIYKGEALLRELADDEYEPAKFELSNRLIEGVVIEQNIEAGEKMLRDLSSKSDLAGLFLANRLIDGEVLSQNSSEGENILRKLAGKGNKEAIIILSSRLHYGKGVLANTNESIALLNKLANSGDADAMRILGEIFINGDQVPANQDEGKKWLIKAAETEDIMSMLILSEYLLEGKGIAKNQQEGKKWLDKAAETEDSKAMRIFGTRLMNGLGLPRNQKDGIKWLQKAIDANNSVAMVTLGRNLLYGDGIDQDVERGEALLKNAVELQNTEAMRILGVELLGGEVLPSNVVEGEKLLRKSAEKDNNSAMTQLGAFLFNGTVIKQNLQEALTWLNKAIVNDDSDAKRVLGAELISGKIIGKDVKRGEELLRNAIQDGNVEAKRAFGKIIIDDQDFKDNFDEGVRLIREAAEEDNREAMSLLANLLFDGKQISQNAREAKQWMKKLIQLGDAYAMENLARRYLYGDGVEKDIREAEKLIARAVEKGNGSAASLLGRFYYENNRLDVAAEYFRTGIKLNSENAKNNFSFMLRRGEVSNYDGTPKIDDLLFQLIEDKDLYSMINYALCFAGGIQRQKDWFKADEIFSQLSNVKEPVKEALMWWHKFLLPKRNDPEGHLVVGWLVRHRFIEDPDNMTVLQRMAKAREGGWDVPDWMDGVVMKNTTKKDGN